MTLRLIVIGLVVANVFLWGWAVLQPEPAQAPKAPEVNQPRALPDVPEIALASEREGLPSGGVQDSRQCFTLGPLGSRSVTLSIQESLSSSVVQINLHESTAVVEQGFWVYLEPFGSYAQASEAVSQLVANGVRDYFIMPEGPYANAVSVGLYEQRSQAETRMRDIEALELGWPLRMEMQRQDEARYWLDFELLPDTETNIESLVADHEGAQHLQVPCRENEASFPPT